jgi:hypothetical protein
LRLGSPLPPASGVGTYSSAQALVGCDAVNCPIGNTTASQLGIASLTSAISPDPLTWTVAFRAGTNILNQPSATRDYYLGVPPSINLSATTAYTSCALFVEGVTSTLHFPGLTRGVDVGDCTDALGSQCSRDLLGQALTELGTTRVGNSVKTASVCGLLPDALSGTAPQSCSRAAKGGGSWGSVVAKGK